MATYTVTNLNDAGAGSLRQAVLDANGAAGADTIDFAAGLTGTITLTSGEIAITDALTIAGSGADKLAVSGGNASRIFLVDDSTAAVQTVSIGGLTLTKGFSTAPGGAIYSAEGLALDHVAVTDNASTSNLGGALNAQTGSLTVANSTFSGNQLNNAGGYGGALATFVVTNVTNSTFYANTAGNGGAIASAGTTTIQGSTLVGNQAAGGASGGGAVFTQGLNLTVSNSILSGNTSTVGGTPSAIVLFGAVPATVTYSLVSGASSGAVSFGAGSITGAAANAYAPGAAVLVNGLGVYLPAAGSLVVDAGDPAFAGAATDEIGRIRVSGGRVDMGAVEYLFSTPATPTPAPTVAPILGAQFANLLRFQTYSSAPLPPTVTTPSGQVLPNPLLEQQKAVQALVAQVDAGKLTLAQAQDRIVDLADATTSVATLAYQFFTGHVPTRAGLDYLVSSPANPTDLNDGYYAGMSLENRYINFAVNLGKLGEGAARFSADYGSLSLADAAAKAYQSVFGAAPVPGKIGEILNTTTLNYLAALGGGDDIGTKAAIVGYFLAEAAKHDLGPLAASNENFLYDLLDGTAAFGANLDIYLHAGPAKVELVGTADGF